MRIDYLSSRYFIYYIFTNFQTMLYNILSSRNRYVKYFENNILANAKNYISDMITMLKILYVNTIII